MDLIGIDFSYNSLIEQVSTPMILSLLQLGYDMTVDNYNFTQARYDALLMFGSLFASKILSNAFIAKMVGKLRNSYGTSITGKLTEPILNYFIYGYLYENQFKKSQIGFKEKSSQELMLTPIVQALLSTMIDGFVISWISGKNPDYVL